MIQIERVGKIPQLLWTQYSSKEFSEQDVGLIEEQSDFIWVVSLDVPVAVAGLIYPSLINPPWLWFLLTHDFTSRQLSAFKFFTKLMHYVPKGTLTGVDLEFDPGFKFAKFFGFEDTGQTAGKYEIYRRT